MKLTFLGTGSAFTLTNFQSNMLLEDAGKRLLIDCGGGVFELYPAQSSAAAAADGTGLGFSVGDLAAVRAALVHAGFAPGEAMENPWGRTFVVRDPDGRRVEVTGR